MQLWHGGAGDRGLVWLTADLHLGHRRIIEFCDRPFKNLFDHDHQLVERWNQRVAPQDHVFVLGDVSFQDRWLRQWTIQKLNGKKHLVRGNHDRTLTHEANLGVWASVQNDLTFGGVFMVHDALGWMAQNAWRRGEWPKTFCGHVHKRWHIAWGRFVNVGVDQWGYAPVAWDEAIKLFGSTAGLREVTEKELEDLTRTEHRA